MTLHLYILEEEEKLPRDCYEVQQQVQNKSGIYRIRLRYSSKPIFAFCDMETEEGGWTVKSKLCFIFLRLFSICAHYGGVFEKNNLGEEENSTVHT